ncbi:MAG TPA: DUF502 domain-containing protein [Chlamydiales bacterium]|nr:DUF502 domain-containing protein [Chlamydiales bacterium]
MKKTLFTGFVILLPVALTLMVVIFLFDAFTSPFVSIVGPLIKLLQRELPFVLPLGITLFLSRLLSLIFLCAFILLLGVVTQWFLVRNLLGWADSLMFRIPFISTVYRVSRDVFNALFSTEGKKAFKRPVMIPFPGHPNFCLAFEAGEVAAECQQKVEVPLCSVFAPTAPHPISGFLFLIPEKDVQGVDMTNEEVVKFLVSCGMIVPESEMKEPDDTLL